ncbi:MAG: energy transducer TonB [Burkholderiaceae bacterium]
MNMPRINRYSRNTLITLSVVLFHIAALWALQAGLLQRAVEIIIPAQILSEFIAPPQPEITPPKPRIAPTPAPVKTAVNPPLKPEPQNEPVTPSPAAVATPSVTKESAATATVNPAPASRPVPLSAPANSQAPARLDLPISTADYLQNPKPAYPTMSKRLGEQGKVLVRVLINTDGTAQKAEILQSSNFERLDQAALNTVLRWRYVPGKRGGVPEPMWFNIPINFVLE